MSLKELVKASYNTKQNTVITSPEKYAERKRNIHPNSVSRFAPLTTAANYSIDMRRSTMKEQRFLVANPSERVVPSFTALNDPESTYINKMLEKMRDNQTEMLKHEQTLRNKGVMLGRQKSKMETNII